MTLESKETLVEEFRSKSILGAAMKVIAKKGAAAATMQEIADAAGVAKGTLYLYFDSREELMEKAADFFFSELLERSRRALTDARPFAEQLRGLLRTQLEFFDLNQQFLRVYVATKYGEDCAAEAKRRRRSRPQYQRYLGLLTSFLEGARERAEIKGFDSERLAAFFAEGVSAILMRRLEGAAPAVELEVDWIVDMMVSGVAQRRRG
jgi:AcrR family transcriptional regulator